MQRFIPSLMVMLLLFFCSTASAQQFESFRQIGEVDGIAAGTVTSVTLTADTRQISYFNAAGLSSVFEVDLTPSRIIRDDMLVYLPGTDFGNTEASMNLDDVLFFTGRLSNAQDPQASVPAHWFRMTLHNGIWSGAFRIANRIYSIDRSRRDNIVEFRDTPSQTTTLTPTNRIKISAVIDEGFVFADTPGDSLGIDSFGHIHALESLHIMEALLNDSLAITLVLDQLVYQPSAAVASPTDWLTDNAISFGKEDNFASFFFSGSNAPDVDIDNRTIVVNKNNFHQLTSAYRFGQLLEINEEAGTLQHSESLFDAAHWSDLQRSALVLPDTALVQTVSLDAPDIEITEAEELINPIPQSILDSEIVEADLIDAGVNSSPGGLLLSDEAGNPGNTNNSPDTGGGGAFSAVAALLLAAPIYVMRRRRVSAISTNT